MFTRNNRQDGRTVSTLIFVLVSGLLLASCSSGNEAINPVNAFDDFPEIDLSGSGDEADSDERDPEEEEPEDSEELGLTLRDVDPCKEKESTEYVFDFNYYCSYKFSLPATDIRFMEYSTFPMDERLYLTSWPGGKIKSFDSNINLERRAIYEGHIILSDQTFPISGHRTLRVNDLNATCKPNGNVVVYLSLEFQDGELDCPVPMIGIDACSDFEGIGHKPMFEPEFDFSKERGFFVVLEDDVMTPFGTRHCEYDFTLWPDGVPLD